MMLNDQTEPKPNIVNEQEFRINESYEETYNRAIKGRPVIDLSDSPPKECESSENLPVSTPLIELPREVHILPNAPSSSKEIRRADSIKQYNVRIQDLFSNVYEVTVSEIDTVKDIKNKLEAEHPEMLDEPQDLILEGKVLEDDQIAKDLLSTEEYTLFMMPKAT